MQKISRIHAKSKVEWDSASGVKEGEVRQILGTHASVVDSTGLIHIVRLEKIRKRINAS